MGYWLRGVGLDWRLVNCSSQSCLVDDCNAWRRLKVKLRFGDGHILLPVAKAEFGFDISRLTKHYADEPGVQIDFQKHLAEGLGCIGRFARAFSWRATQNGVAILQTVIFRLSAGAGSGSDNFDAAA